MDEGMEKLGRLITEHGLKIVTILEEYTKEHGDPGMVKVEELADFIESEITLEGTSIKAVDKTLTVGCLMGETSSKQPMKPHEVGWRPTSRQVAGLKLTVGDLMKERR